MAVSISHDFDHAVLQLRDEFLNMAACIAAKYGTGKVSELDAKLLLSIFLLKKCKEKQNEFIEKAKEKSPLQKYYQILQTIGSLYDEEIILHSEKTEKVLEQMMKIVQTGNFKCKI
jgi:hypothetical protein